VRRALGLLAVAAVAGGCGGTGTQVDGRSLYTAHCSACHSGNGPGPDLAATRYSRARILDVIDHGRGDMPADLVGTHDAERIASYLTR
jgi:cytochrome c551